MTLLGSEHSLLIRSKFRTALKSPAAFQEQKKNLEKAKGEDYLKHKVRSRPEKSDLASMHILQDSSAEGSTQAVQMKMKRARLADDLNERIALRPGPLELVEKNIIPLESTVKEAMKGNGASYSKSVDAFAFEEDSSDDGLSPDQEKGDEMQGNPSSSPQETKFGDASSSPNPATTQNHMKENEKELQEVANPQSHPCQLASNNHLSPTGPVAPNAAVVKNKPSTDSKNRHKKPKDIKPKVKKLKYHQYIPPDQKAEKSPPPMDSAYARLLQQQQLFLQLQILSQQQQQHFSYQGMHHSHLNQQNEQMNRNANTPTVSSPSLSPVKTTFSGQSNMSSMKPGLLPSNLDDLKVSELRQQLRIRGLPVSGTKTSLMERLRPFQECSNTVPAFGEITTVTFPVTPNNSLSSYQTHPSAGVISNGFYQFGSTSSTPPISPASSDLSVNGSLPDTFSDGPMSSPQFGLHPSPIHLSAEESLMSSINSSSYQAELEGMDAEKDKMLVEKQKVINELTWKLQQEQRQVEELRLQLQKRKGSCGPQEKALPSQHFYGVQIKQENVSSCPFASKQMTMKSQANNATEKLGSCATQPMPCLINNHCMEAANPNSMSSTFLSPQCSPQHSPLGTTNSPQHISLPPSPNSHCHYLLSVSPSSQGDTQSVSPQHTNTQICTGQNAGSTACFSPNQTILQPPYVDHSENKQCNKDGVSPKSPAGLGKMNTLQPSPQGGQKLSVPCTTFSNAPASDSKQLPSYEDAVRQQVTRSQQIDELLDVLIESGEMPANAKDERSCGQKMTQLGNANLSAPNSHLPYENCSNNDSHLEVLLNSHSPIGRATEIPLLKIGNDDVHFERVIEGFSGKVTEDILPSREILETSLSPMETQMSPSSVESTALHHLSFTESPWETMEWLDLTPPSSATGLGSLTTTGPSIFNTDFLDVNDLNLNNAMDLHLEHW